MMDLPPGFEPRPEVSEEELQRQVAEHFHKMMNPEDKWAPDPRTLRWAAQQIRPWNMDTPSDWTPMAKARVAAAVELDMWAVGFEGKR